MNGLSYYMYCTDCSVIGMQTLARTPSLYGSVIQRVLTIPELLEMIFSFAGDDDLRRSALVCKVWSEVAFDILWRKVEDLPRMLKLLAPIEHCPQGHVSVLSRF